MSNDDDYYYVTITCQQWNSWRTVLHRRRCLVVTPERQSALIWTYTHKWHNILHHTVPYMCVVSSHCSCNMYTYTQYDITQTLSFSSNLAINC